ncbi:MAG: glycosyltransferase family 8 protein [Candidatus Gastranaerophilales bacterium]
MKKEKHMDIVLISSQYFIRHTLAMIISLLNNSKNNLSYNFYIIEQDISVADKKRVESVLKEKCKIEYIKVSNEVIDRFFNIKVSSHVTNLTYSKVILPDIFPKLDKILFLDSDMIVLNDIEELWNIEFGNSLICAAEDVGASYIAKRLWGGTSSKRYYNTGVMLIDLKGMRDFDYKNKINTITQEQSDKYLIGEQDIISDVFNEKISPINIKWNMYHKYHPNFANFIAAGIKDEIICACKKPSIVHFVGPDKPWHVNSTHEYKNEYMKYYKQTPFYNPVNEFMKCVYCNLKKIIKNKQQLPDGRIKTKILGGLYKKVKTPNQPSRHYVMGIKIPLCKIRKNHVAKLEFIHHITQELACQNAKLEARLSSLILAKTYNHDAFANYQNRFEGKEIVLLATGPTAKNYTPIEGAIHVGVNGAVYFDNVELDFVFIQDNTINQSNNENLTDDVLNYSKNNCKKFVGMPSNLIRMSNIESHKPMLPIPISKICGENISNYTLSGRGKFSDLPYDISNEPVANLWGTAFSAMQFILYTNPKRVYLVGCDCTSGYAYNIKQKNYSDVSSHVKSWQLIKKYTECYFPDVEIISINPVALKGMF